MSTVVEYQGREVTVPPSLRGGILHIVVRATDETTFNAAAVQLGVLVDDPERGLIPAPYVDVCRIGPLVRTPATYDRDGNEVTPAVVDSRYHANIWLGRFIVERGVWIPAAVRWAEEGRGLLLTERNKSEDGFSLNGVESLDPDTIATPANRLA